MRLFVFAAAALLLTGCATPPQEPNPPRYWDLPTSHVIPETEEERVAECGRIRDEMARIESIGMSAGATLSPLYAAAIQTKARRNLAQLENRAAEVGCRAAFSSADGAANLRQCFAQCKDLTDRTDEQCFDACR